MKVEYFSPFLFYIAFYPYNIQSMVMTFIRKLYIMSVRLIHCQIREFQNPEGGTMSPDNTNTNNSSSPTFKKAPGSKRSDTLTLISFAVFFNILLLFRKAFVCRYGCTRINDRMAFRTYACIRSGNMYCAFPFDITYYNCSSKASSFVIFERFTLLEVFVYSRKCQTLGVSPAKPGAYPI